MPFYTLQQGGMFPVIFTPGPSPPMGIQWQRDGKLFPRERASKYSSATVSPANTAALFLLPSFLSLTISGPWLMVDAMTWTT
jgi:hypothetical protein